MNPRPLALALLLPACSPPHQSGPDQFDDDNLSYTYDKDLPLTGNRPAVDAAVDAWMATNHVAGCGVSLAEAGHVTFVQGYGLRDVAAGDPFDIDTMAPVGSISKTITALATMRMVEDGLVDLDDEIGDFVLGEDPSWAGMTLRHGLSHTTGLPKWPTWTAGLRTEADFEAAYPGIERPTLFPWVVQTSWRTTPTQTTPGSAALYSNIGVEAVGAVIDYLSMTYVPDQAGYERYAWNTVALPTGDWFDPDDMLTPVSAAPWRMGDMPNRSLPYSWNGAGYDRVADEWDVWWPGGAGGASGAWMMTPGDLGRLTLAFRRDGRVIDPASHDTLTTWHSNAISGGYGLGVALGSQLGRTALWHTGLADGHQAMWLYWPTEDIGVGVVCNSDQGSIAGLATAVGATALPLTGPPIEWDPGEVGPAAYGLTDADVAAWQADADATEAALSAAQAEQVLSSAQ
ncbi:MAG: serine hydrolase domain-containing protein [Myxococcota bacterium]